MSTSINNGSQNRCTWPCITRTSRKTLLTDQGYTYNFVKEFTPCNILQHNINFGFACNHLPGHSYQHTAYNDNSIWTGLKNNTKNETIKVTGTDPHIKKISKLSGTLLPTQFFHVTMADYYKFKYMRTSKSCTMFGCFTSFIVEISRLICPRDSNKIQPPMLPNQAQAWSLWAILALKHQVPAKLASNLDSLLVVQRHSITRERQSLKGNCTFPF
jgi:hypothetical protein